MKSFLFTLVSILIFGSCTIAQTKSNPFQRVSLPDSIVNELEEAYKKNAENVNAGKNVFNLSNRKDFVFRSGIYSFQGQGPHFPRRIFIYNETLLFIFENEGAINPKGIIQEFLNSIDILGLTERQIVKYTQVIGEYLGQEIGNTYGSEVK